MWTPERHHRILSLINSAGRLKTEEVAQAFGVSRETVRRDLLELESAGHLRRVHGGAVAREVAPEEPFSTRTQTRRQEKEEIAMAAAGLIEPGQTCFIDAGTTTLAFARALGSVGGLRIITNSLDIAGILMRDGHEVVLLGGALTSDVPATFGPLALQAIDHFVADVAVIGPVAVDARHGIMNYELHEAELARAMIDRAKQTLILADHTKLGASSRVVVCKLAQTHMLITDRQGDSEILAELRIKGLSSILVAGQPRDLV
ncbi:transcriptional regulator, DeoR family [Arboricoccus pini]|uniref:Transcriptional regulator, DeoR family n=1 Tax=Arboricoccus pini TaxID=1963835 RepID=A0A212RKE2_9PROT|nr:DeoR/GlpR family DNA-binding transcription regulator [Arboricoccus pini]SNB72938.1 transcriptional regulator, DeoR family [Arboricoccus pini]